MKRLISLTFYLILSWHSLKCQTKILDSINHYYSQVIDVSLDDRQRLDYALKAKRFSDELSIDSIKLRVQRQLAYLYFKNEMYEPYIPLNKANLKIAEKLKDTIAISVASSNLGSFYRYEEQNDSSYYYYSKALDFYGKKEVSLNKVTALLALADIQQEEKAYVGAEEDAISAIKILNQLPVNQDTLDAYWSLYNVLAIISQYTDNKDKAIQYYNQSIYYSKEMENGFGYELYSLNNMANAYRKFGDYQKALGIYDNLISLRDKYEKDEPDFYPTLLINIAKAKFDSGDYKFEEIETYLLEAHNECSDLGDQLGTMAASLELSRLYLKHNKKDLAKKFGNEALDISNSSSNNEYKMEALKTLSYLYDGETGKDFLREHIKLSDSLQKVERLVQNKFARVKFDTDQLEAENQQISKENFYLIIVSIGLLLSAILVYVIISQRAKNKELLLMQVQQKANEDIYNLMLNQQDKVEEARAQEKIRVSKELHDGVLGRLFGTRLSLDSLNFTEGKDAMLTRANYISQLKTIEEDIRKISHEMNTDFVAGSGFMDILSELVETQTNAYGLSYNFDFTDDLSWDVLPNKIKINIYRIVQESMQNIYKHAEAKHIKISISHEKELICLSIIDDGKGFDTSKSRKGIGLKNMTSRVDDINGNIEFISVPNEGTTVKVEIPYTP